MIRAAGISLAVLAAPAGAATVPHFVIEAAECGTVHTLREDVAGPVLMVERGSRRYVCGPYPLDLLPEYDALDDLKGPRDETPPDPVSVIAVAPMIAPVSGDRRATAPAWSASWPASSAGAFSFPRVHVRGCGCEPPVPPVEPPAPPPVPLPGALGLLLAGIFGLWRVKR